MKKALLTSLAILCLLSTVFLTRLAFDIQTVEASGVQVGVKTGDWIKHDYAVTGWPPETPYPEWLKVEFLNVEGTNATVRVTMHMSDGTEQDDTVPVDIVAGGQALGLSGLVIPANLTVGESIFISGYGDVAIAGETTGIYAGANRTVVYTSISQYGSELTYYWDKQTGVLVKASVTSGGLTSTAEATETNMWEAAPSWTETIYIRADGSVEPDTAPISSVDNVTYILTDNIFRNVPEYSSAIVVEKDNIILDGAGRTLQGTGSGIGMNITERSKVTVRDMRIKAFSVGIVLSFSSYSSVSGNNVTASNNVGIGLWHSSYSSVSGNNITASKYYGIWLEASSDNSISGNHIRNDNMGVVLCFSSSNNTISQNNVTANNNAGIELWSGSLDNSISGNHITNNSVGIVVNLSSNNTVTRNKITNNNNGIKLYSSSNNTFFHNDFIDNTKQVYIRLSGYANFWDEGHPSGGNYWSNYTGVDSDYDGIGDTSHIIDVNNTDNYPLMGMFSDFNATSEYHVQTICNSTISDFQFNGTAISFNVTGENGTTGICRICIPTSLMHDTFRVFVDGTEILPPPEPLLCSNNTDTYLYFTYEHSTQKVVIASDTMPPTISILSPENKPYTVSYVPLIFTVSESTSWIGYSLDSQNNVTISGNTTLIGLSNGAHTIAVYANDTAGNIGYSDMVYFTIDTTPPSISITSPENKTYATTDIPLTFTVDESVSWMAYSLDGQANMTITGNTTLSGLSEGSHSLTVYGEDTTGNAGASERIYFTVETLPSPFWMQWWFWAIVAIVVVALAGAAYFSKKRKPPTPPTSPGGTV